MPTGEQEAFSNDIINPFGQLTRRTGAGDDLLQVNGGTVKYTRGGRLGAATVVPKHIAAWGQVIIDVAGHGDKP